MRLKNIFPAALFALIGGCALNTTPGGTRPIAMSGKFQVKLSQNAQFFQDVKLYPVGGTLVEDVPYGNQFIPAGSSIIGNYSNGGFRCTIVWTAIILPDTSAISNSKGIAFSSCGARSDLTESQVITAKWN